tara:strand:+ start:33 stop:767 length:735 start_codon:yes stop_codon:yes gene_type:complete
VRNNIPVINVYKKKTVKSEIVTQLLYGDTFKRLKKFGSWIKIKNNSDNYKGYIRNKNFPKDQKNSHKIFSLSSNLYSRPNKKYKIKKKLSFGSKIKASEKKGNFYRFDNYWIEKKNIKSKNYKTKSIFSLAKKFTNVKYKWGGNFYTGIDCSALIQLLINFNNKFCPRDTKDQIKYFKKKVKLSKVKKDDLIFWKGHVAIVLNKKKLIHAYGPLKKVMVMPINNTIKRIYKTANLKVIGVRRIS